MPISKATENELLELLAEGFHTGFRKASSHPEAHKAWKAIKALPTDEWGQVLDFLMSGLRPWLNTHFIEREP